MRFYNYFSVQDWAHISRECVRSTEGTTQCARVVIRATDAGGLSAKNIYRFILCVQIIPEFSKNKLFIRYNTGRQIFERLPVFPPNEAPLSKVSLISAGIIAPKNEENSAEFTSIAGQIPSDIPLFEKTFPVPPHETVFRVTSQGAASPQYREPPSGTKAPLWCVGGALNLDGEDPDAEPIFGFPYLKTPQEAAVRLLRRSALIAQDARFATNEALRFQAFPEVPLSLKDEIEQGALTLNLSEGCFISRALKKGREALQCEIEFERAKPDSSLNNNQVKHLV